MHRSNGEIQGGAMHIILYIWKDFCVDQKGDSEEEYKINFMSNININQY